MNARFLASIRSADPHSPSDRRMSERKVWRVTGLLQVDGSTPVRVKTLDLSLKGIALLLPSALPYGTVAHLCFYFHANGLLKEFKAKIQILNAVFLCSDIRAGCRFLQVDEKSRKTLEEFMR